MSVQTIRDRDRRFEGGVHFGSQRPYEGRPSTARTCDMPVHPSRRSALSDRDAGLEPLELLEPSEPLEPLEPFLD